MKINEKEKKIVGYICSRWETENDENSLLIRRKMINAIRINLTFLKDTKKVKYWKMVYFIPRDYQLNIEFLRKLKMVLPVDAFFEGNKLQGFKKYDLDKIKIWSEFIYEDIKKEQASQSEEIELENIKAEKIRVAEINLKIAAEQAQKLADKAAKNAEKERLKFELKVQKANKKSSSK